MQHSRDLILAINTYFAFKWLDGSRNFSSPYVEKQCSQLVMAAADGANVQCTISPGKIHLSKGKEKVSHDGPIFPFPMS